MTPKTRKTIEAIALKHRLGVLELFGPRRNRRQTRKHVAARHEAVLALYDPATEEMSEGRKRTGFVYTKRRVALELGMCHTTVLYALRKHAGIARVRRTAQ